MNHFRRRTLVSNYQATNPFLKNRGAADSSLEIFGETQTMDLNFPA